MSLANLVATVIVESFRVLLVTFFFLTDFRIKSLRKRTDLLDGQKGIGIGG
jgi:hypothetical protein